MPHRSKLFFVGTGPGAIGLVTKRAFWALKKADIVIYGRFINPNLLFYASKKARYISACNDEEAIFSELSKLDGSRNTVWLTIGDPIFFSKHNRRMEKFAKLANLEIEIIPLKRFLEEVERAGFKYSIVEHSRTDLYTIVILEK